MQSNLGKIYLFVGFFGSGKTTIIRRLLNQENGQKYAIIQNQFAEGEMGIEQPLIMDESGTPFSSFLELPNGCICCSAKTDLIAAIQYILENTQVKNIVVQTNGMADPAESIKQFWFDEQMNIRAELHSVVAIISSRKWDDIIKDQILQKQIVFANKILISFVDVVGEQKYKSIVQSISQINNDSIIERSDKVDIATFLQEKSFFDRQTLSRFSPAHSNHHHKIRPIFIKGGCRIENKLQLQKKVGQLLWQKGLKILRMKGAICLQSSPFVHELQCVEDLFQIKQTKSSVNLYNKESRILIVGEGLQQGVFRQSFQIDM